jgi:hypothetical protein
MGLKIEKDIKNLINTILNLIKKCRVHTYVIIIFVINKNTNTYPLSSTDQTNYRIFIS